MTDGWLMSAVQAVWDAEAEEARGSRSDDANCHTNACLSLRCPCYVAGDYHGRNHVATAMLHGGHDDG